MNIPFQNRSYLTLLFALALFLNSCSNDSGATHSEVPEDRSSSYRNGADDSSSSVASYYVFTDWSTCVNDGVCGTFIDKREAPATTYKWVTIGTQMWMAENMTLLPSVNTLGDTSRTVAKYYVLDYAGTSVSAAKAMGNYSTYGVLYNFPAALTACPKGWHLPHHSEWVTLRTTVGAANAGTILKSKTGWKSGGITGTNKRGFFALPGGMASCCAFYGGGGYAGSWWTATVDIGDSSYAIYREIGYNTAKFDWEISDKRAGYSVRCIHD